jgi:hypothetical protein
MSAMAIAPSSTQPTNRVFEILARRRDAEIQFHFEAKQRNMDIFSACINGLPNARHIFASNMN